MIYKDADGNLSQPRSFPILAIVLPVIETVVLFGILLWIDMALYSSPQNTLVRNFIEQAAYWTASAWCAYWLILPEYKYLKSNN